MTLIEYNATGGNMLKNLQLMTSPGMEKLSLADKNNF